MWQEACTNAGSEVHEKELAIPATCRAAAVPPAKAECHSTSLSVGAQTVSHPRRTRTHAAAPAEAGPASEGGQYALLEQVAFRQQRMLNELLGGSGERLLDAAALQRLRADAQRLQSNLLVALPDLGGAAATADDAAAPSAGGGGCRQNGAEVTGGMRGRDGQVQSVGSCASSVVGSPPGQRSMAAAIDLLGCGGHAHLATGVHLRPVLPGHCVP